MKKHLFIFCLATVALVGCGGGGGLLGSNANASLAVLPNPADYGVPVTLKWETNRAIRIESSNFGLGEGDLSGTITDNPGVDTTYEYVVRVQNEDHDPFEITCTETVTVAKSSKSILIVGDAAVSGPNQVKDSLETLTTGPVAVSATVPSSLTHDVLVLHPSASLSAADRTKVEAVLASGKAVLFIGESVVKVSGGNVASMGGMLAGATAYHTTSAQYATFRSEAGFVPLSVVTRGVRLTENSADGLLDVSTSADRILTTANAHVTSAFAYRNPTGGKTAFVAEDGVGAGVHAKGYDISLRCIVRWCMDGS